MELTEVRTRKDDMTGHDVFADLPTFKIADEEIWAGWKQKNEHDPVGVGAIRFAARYANALESRLAQGDKLEDVAEEVSYDCGEDINAFQYSVGVAVLAGSWEHGEALRRWHNLRWQTQDEGVRANETGEVLIFQVNPLELLLGDLFKDGVLPQE
ncbi:hypothetical protein J4U01_gp010 [Mycobacterium phage Kumao]|uniref:Uncharacterized protein n=1 Tax=Mycobacterium phage Kumao TaxID=2041344 RepID=A0A2D1GPV5_9CAUD|nr:hypothetical protein J4U01_gp010 [Mycobacterium phage Kumao]ATN93973.1 hypothetical protein SEA_KUMAO_10 [Mycobacterium phage Kumao]